MCGVVNKVVNDLGNHEDKLIEILIEVQRCSELNYLSKEDIKCIAEELDISVTKVYGIANFYSMLSTEKRGKNVIQICDSAPCHLKNGQGIVKIFEEILGIKMGEVTQDELFSLEYTSCIGECDISPAIRINDKVFGSLNRGKIFNLLASVTRGEEI